MIKKIVHRVLPNTNQLPTNIDPLLARLYLARGINDETELEKNLAKLSDYRLLKGIDDAVELLHQALVSNKKIVIIGDFDVDGATSTALIVLALTKMGAKQVDYLIPDRFEQGYGLSKEVVLQAAAKGAELIITVDTGISSFEGTELAHQKGMSVIITDHHLPGETVPLADAIINPNNHDCPFPSKHLAGVGVAFYLMIALRVYLRQMDWFKQQGIIEYNLAELLDLVALGTVADVVQLDQNNRILVHQGLNRIRSGCCCVGIQALLAIANKPAEKLTATDLGFQLAPRLNAAGRLESMSLGVELLLCNEMVSAKNLAMKLDQLNRDRKKIEQTMQQEAMQLFAKMETGFDDLPNSILLYNDEWHQGVIGILASRIKDRFYRPVIAFASVGEGILKGSARSIADIHIRDVLERLNCLYPDIMLSFGGHAMAAGVTLYKENFVRFSEKFNQLIEQVININQLNDILLTDGELNLNQLTLATAELLQYAGPWGQGFPEPVFDGKFKVLKQQLVVEKHLKIVLEPLNGGYLLEGIVFNIDRSCWPDNSIKQVQIAYRLAINEFRGNRQLQLMVEQICPL